MLRTINGLNGPDILGVCEVENENVLKKFRDSLQQTLDRGYKIIHADTQEERGIDVAFLYDKDKFCSRPAESIFSCHCKEIRNKGHCPD